MIHINLNGYEPDEKWLEKSEELTKELKKYKTKAKRDEIIDANDGHWGKIKDELLQFSYRKCWFSEARELYSYYQVEHFRPKKKCIEIDDSECDGYWWMAFDWHNYRICGGVGNVTKGNHFAVKRNKVSNHDDSIDDEEIYLLDPLVKEDVRQIAFNNNGEAIPSNPDTSDWSHQRAVYTIKHLKLNYDPLVEERRRIWSELTDLIEEITKTQNEYDAQPSAVKRKALEALKDKIRKFIAPCTELSSTYRACLRASREEWAKDLLQEQIDVKKYCKQYQKN